MALERRPLLMEFGGFGTGVGGRSAGGFASPVSSRRFNTWPFIPNAKIMAQKEQERQRRRNRLRELAVGWYTFGPAQSSGASTAASGAAPGKIF